MRSRIQVYAYVGGNPASRRDPRGLDNPGMGPYDAPPPRCNKCGSGSNEPFVPDAYPESCGNHDQCYDMLGRSKWSCDKELWKDAFVESGPWPNVVGPSIFFLGVFLFGGEAYQNAQSQAAARR